MTQVRKLKFQVGMCLALPGGAVCIPSHPIFTVYQVRQAFVTRSILDAIGWYDSDLMSVGEQELVIFMVKQWYSAVNPLRAPLLLYAGMGNHLFQRIMVVLFFFSSYSTPFRVQNSRARNSLPAKYLSSLVSKW